ncbi:MAG: hypothetical protein IKN16_01000 [Selenomonadaceae bacterium]|nr:hypothetical protein [Selenomonadaceae bacterium]
MQVDLEERSIAEQLKFLATYRGYTLKTLSEEFNRRFGTKYVQQSFSCKINNHAISYDELKQFGELLGFKVKLELVDKGGDDNDRTG